MPRLTSRQILFKASPVMLAVALGLLGPAALNDDEEEARGDRRPATTAGLVDADGLLSADDAPVEAGS